MIRFNNLIFTIAVVLGCLSSMGHALTYDSGGASGYNANSTITVSTLNVTGTISGTIDAKSGVLASKGYGYLILAAPHLVQGTNTTFNVTTSSAGFGQANFSASVSTASNYVEYRIVPPSDLDTTVEINLQYFKFSLLGADTGKQRYMIAMSTTSDSSGYAGNAVGNYINLDYVGDASGASGDVETVSNIDLTGWAATLTPSAGYLWVIRIARAGDDATNDTSTVPSLSGPLVLRYGFSQ